MGLKDKVQEHLLDPKHEWVNFDTKSFPACDIWMVDMSEFGKFILCRDGEHPPQNLAELSDSVFRYARAKLHASDFRTGIVVSDSSRAVGPKRMESDRRKRVKLEQVNSTARESNVTMDGPSDGSGDVTGYEFPIRWDKLSPANPVGKAACKAYSTKILGAVEYRLRRFVSFRLKTTAWSVLCLKRNQTVIVAGDDSGSQDSVTFWKYSQVIGAWESSSVGGVRAAGVYDGEADVLAPLILSHVMQHRAAYDWAQKLPAEVSIGSFSCDSDWILILLLWAASRDLVTNERSDTKYSVYWCKKPPVGKNRGKHIVVDVHTILDSIRESIPSRLSAENTGFRLARLQDPSNTGGATALNTLRVALNFTFACVAYGCDFVQCGAGFKNNITTMGKVVDTIRRVGSELPLDASVRVTSTQIDDPVSSIGAAIDMSLRTTAVATLSKSSKIALSETQIRNAFWTTGYWLAASIGNDALKRVCPECTASDTEGWTHEYKRSGFVSSTPEGKRRPE